jgi:hypothetical protein
MRLEANDMKHPITAFGGQWMHRYAEQGNGRRAPQRCIAAPYARDCDMARQSGPRHAALSSGRQRVRRLKAPVKARETSAGEGLGRTSGPQMETNP